MLSQAPNSASDPSHIVRGINVEAPQGKIIALVGPEFSGKTALASTLSGITHPVTGQVLVPSHLRLAQSDPN